MNKSIRIITFAPYEPLDVEIIYRELEFLLLDQTFTLEKAKCMHKKVRGLLPTTIANYFNTETRSEHRYNLRPRVNDRIVFQSNTATGRKSIQYGGQILWRDLPQ